MRALVIVDVQNDFCEGGSLAVSGGLEVANKISVDLIGNKAYAVIGFTKDWHIDPGEHFSDSPDYLNSWPPHCVAHTYGARLNINMVAAVYVKYAELLAKLLDEVNVFHKGQYAASYSGADGKDRHDIDLITWLREHDIVDVDVVGIAFDYCVFATAVDLSEAGFNVTVLKDYTASVHPENDETNIIDLVNTGVSVQ